MRVAAEEAFHHPAGSTDYDTFAYETYDGDGNYVGRYFDNDGTLWLPAEYDWTAEEYLADPDCAWMVDPEKVCFTRW